MRKLITNGTIVNASGKLRADVLIEGTKISAIGRDLDAKDAQVVDATGCFVFPGFIDTHTHFDLDFDGGLSTADNFPTGTQAAILGGTTTVLDFVDHKRGSTMGECINAWHKKALGSSCSYGFHMGLSQWNEAISNEMADMRSAGLTSYKMYMVYASRVDDGEIYCAMQRARELGQIVSLHCENYYVLQRKIKEQLALGNTGAMGHALSRPAEVEAEAINRYLRIAQMAQAPAYVVHLSCYEGLLAARAARERGQEVYLETCPQYLLLDESCYKSEDAHKYVMSPPLREKYNNELLLKALRTGEIDTIGTDHCSFTMEQKQLGASDFTKIPNGSAGVQNRPALYHTYAVEAGYATLEQMAAQLSENAARIFGMYPHKGRIAADADADIVIWDPSYEETISHKTLAHNCDNSPYEGIQTKGRARDVFLNGELAVQNGKLIKAGLGKFVHRGLPQGYRS